MIGCPQPERLCKVSGRQAGSSLRGGHHSVRILVSAIMAIALSLMGSTAAFAAPTYTPTASASSGLTAVITVDASASSICSISGGTVSFIGAGTCVLDANQAGDETYNPAPQVQQSFDVGKASQTVAFTSTAPTAARVGGATYTPTAHATSGLAAAITVDASASSICSISGGTVSFIGAGTCVLDANQAGNSEWSAATQVQQSFVVAPAMLDQSVEFTSLAPTDAVVNGSTYTPTASASSGLTAVITVDASASSICSISGGTVSFIGAGTCVLDANQAGDDTYNPATQVQQSLRSSAPAMSDGRLHLSTLQPTAARVVARPTPQQPTRARV
jgi:hypothetical protein